VNRTTERPWGRPASSNPEPQGGAAFAASRGQYHRRRRDARPELFRVATPQGVKVAGAFVWHDGEQVFQKVTHADSHMLRVPCEAWAIATEALEEALRRGVERVVIRDGRYGVWWTRLADFEQHGVPIDRQHGPQVALSLSWWSFVPNDSVTVRQGSLFAEVGT